MEQLTVKRYHISMSWNYEKEEAWLNEMSEQGFHFQKAGLMKSTFVRDESSRYTYRLDYQTGNPKDAEFQNYIALYQDAGWEYVSSYGSMWHYFRRVWQPGEQLKLYTDRDSLVAQYKKIQRLMGIMLLINLGVLLANTANLIRLFNYQWGVAVPVLVIYVIILGLLGYGYMKMDKKIKKLLL